jgi:hypothetical protein
VIMIASLRRHDHGLTAAAALLILAGCGTAAAPVSGPDADDPDAGAAVTEVDGGVPEVDAGVADAAPDSPPDLTPDFPPPPGPYARPTYTKLSEAGLYQDLASRTLAPGFLDFSPTHVLWADGAEKHRWIRLPPGTQIDTSDMDHWVFPIGTRVFKEFLVEGVALETRLVERYGTGADDFWMGSFVWRADGSDADFVEAGQKDLGGTSHDAPSQKDCRYCHAGEPGRVLGFSALQLSRDGDGVTLDWLRQAGMLTVSPPPGAPFHPPGDAATAETLGYLHANCGHCHNPNGTSWPDTQMMLRLAVGETTPEGTELYRSSIGQKLNYWRHAGFAQRVVAGDPDASAMMFRVQSRVMGDGMPPLATETPDPRAAALIGAWIRSLPAPPPAPAP